MPVDRPHPADDTDEPGRRRPPDDPQTPDTAPPLALDQANRVTVHRANRAEVEQAYAAHQVSARCDTADAVRPRDSWAEELPSLQAAWEQHQDRVSRRERERATPQAHTDGSWSSGEARRLTPEQNAEATKACADIHDEGERVARPAMLQIEAADPNRSLVGLEHMLKGEDRLKEKIADALQGRPGLTVTQALSIVPDPVRFTFEYSPDGYADGVLADVERLKEIGLEEVKLKNLWSDGQYKGINSQWRRQRLACASRCSSTHQRAWRLRSSPIRHTSASAAQTPRPPNTTAGGFPTPGKCTPRRSARHQRDPRLPGEMTWLRRSPTTRSSTSSAAATGLAESYVV